ncbi:hypothetical protein EYZ11_009336 [Aspergillus tanneri]|uniref:Transcription factor 25 n=1 Tax=Aspergillus tanneri TaxID=1220188 RepID=A0A4S3J8E0_9EURO|nr:hypothetical protein EYZ11_009336 [Aspergillus tanneri]
MSSRALRKLQKLREQELQQAEHEEHDSSDDEPAARLSKPKLNTFDLLNDIDDYEDDQGSNEDIQEPVIQPTECVPTEIVPTNPTNSKKKKKTKKKKASTKNAADGLASTKLEDGELDEIDRALKELAVDPRHFASGTTTSAAGSTQAARDASFAKTPEDLLAIEPKFLNATNEMRRLFGNVVLENFDQQDSGTGRRRDRNRETIDLGQALSGRYSPASRGQSLAGVTLRRNVLMQGKDEWPRASSGGLGMELAEKLETGATVYRILHNASYLDVQRQFDICVESMDPQRMIQLLQYNPYHISTLLQVSEIAKHQGDHAVSADLLERALFNIGRSTHSSFGIRLKEGQAKLDFIHMENRELWLVGWRYIANLGMKGTWRTAYEWAKMLLGLNANDPYCIRLLLDNLALRGREYSHFVELCTQTRLSKDWSSLPNIQCSLALAYLRLGKPKECREQLRRSMSRYPWVYCKLAHELDIQPMPKRIWAKDLWNTPEAVSLIVEVADTLDGEEEPVEPPEITLDIARHVVLSDIPRVTTHLPSRFISGRISASDPLPPYDSDAFRQQSDPTPSYLSQVPEVGRPQWLQVLLDQLQNGALHFPRFQRGEDQAAGDDGLAEGERERDLARPQHPTAEQQPLLEQWLLGDGLFTLEAFLRQYGVDRGNWGDVVDYSPLTEYVDALDAVLPDARQRLLHGSIREAMGEMVVDMLEDELQLQQYDEDEEE